MPRFDAYPQRKVLKFTFTCYCTGKPEVVHVRNFYFSTSKRKDGLGSQYAPLQADVKKCAKEKNEIQNFCKGKS